MKTKITELLGIEYPVVQGAMAWIAEHHLAAAVSKAGGLGIIAGGAAPVDYIREEIRKSRAITDKPLGMNIMLLSPNADDLAQLAIDEKIEVLTTGAGNPGKYMAEWKNAGIKVMPVVASVALAKRMARAGADAVIAEGMESGGHIGELTTMPLVPQVVDAVDIPVIAAGGIADGRRDGCGVPARCRGRAVRHHFPRNAGMPDFGEIQGAGSQSDRYFHGCYRPAVRPSVPFDQDPVAA